MKKMVFDNADAGMDFGSEIIAKGAMFEIGKHSMANDVFTAGGKGIREEVAHLILERNNFDLGLIREAFGGSGVRLRLRVLQ